MSLAPSLVLGLLAVALPAAAQCLVENPGGSKTNPNRPADPDVSAAGFSPLTSLNRALPKWLCFSSGYRARFESYTAGNFQPDASDTYLLSRFRLGMAFKPAAWLKVYGELQDANAFWKTPPAGPPYQTTWDLRRAYVDLGDLERSRVGLRVGRQDLNFGNARLVGTSYWRNASRGFDAVNAVLNWRRLRLNAIAASPVIVGANGLSHHAPGNNLHGVYASLRDLAPRSALEPYVFWRVSPSIRTERAGISKLDEKTVGLRWAGSASGFDYDAEAAGQAGNIGKDRIRAWAWTAIAGYTFESMGTRPRLFASYAFASGDRNPADGIRGSFDQLYPSIHNHHGLADQAGWQNLREVRAGARFSLRRNWTVAGAYSDWWLASPKDAFYNSSGGIVVRDPTGLSGTHIGEELDAETWYRVNRQFELGAGLGRILPGQFLERTKRNHTYTYPYVMLNYNVF